MLIYIRDIKSHKTLGGICMKKRIALLLALLLIFSAFVPLSAARSEKQNYLVEFSGEINRGLLRAHGLKDQDILHSFRIFDGALLSLTEKQAFGLSKNPHIKVIEPDQIAVAYGKEIPWGITRVQSEQAHSAGYTGLGVKVAVLDTGIDRTHPELVDRVKGGFSAFIDSANSNPYNDVDGHGTHVAGTIAASLNNQTILGVAYNADLYAVKVLGNDGSGSYSGIAKGIEWAVENGMDIINMSLGGSQGSAVLETACNAAYNAGVLIVAAAGNEGRANGRGDTVGYPAKYASVIAVAATDINNARASFSSTGPAVEIAAPGANIKSTIPNNSYASWDGTSMACPHVAGVAALVLSANPNLTNVQLRAILNQTAINLGTPTFFGNGLVQAKSAIDYALSGTNPTEPEPQEPTPEPSKPGKGNSKKN
jgi:subtilisin